MPDANAPATRWSNRLSPSANGRDIALSPARSGPGSFRPLEVGTAEMAVAKWIWLRILGSIGMEVEAIRC